MQTNHIHKFEQEGNIYKCECGKQILKFNEKDNQKIGMRSNGRKYTKKANQNRFFFPKEYTQFEDALKDKQKHSIKSLLNTGSRVMELQKAQVRDFVYNPQGRSRIILRHTKTKARKGEFGSGRVRDIPLSRQFAKYLFNYIQDNNLTEKDKLNIHSTPAINIFMKKTAEEIGLTHSEDFSAHTLRKTFEIWLMALGVDSLPLTAHLGHDIKTAAGHYVSPDVFSWEDKRLIRQILGDLYEDRR